MVITIQDEHTTNIGLNEGSEVSSQGVCIMVPAHPYPLLGSKKSKAGDARREEQHHTLCNLERATIKKTSAQHDGTRTRRGASYLASHTYPSKLTLPLKVRNDALAFRNE
jgi:hypothetical protein